MLEPHVLPTKGLETLERQRADHGLLQRDRLAAVTAGADAVAANDFAGWFFVASANSSGS